jgi:hypothetical protein
MTTPRRLAAVSLKRKGKLATLVPLVVLLVFLLQVHAIRRLPNDLNGKPLNSTFFRNLKNTAVGVPIPTSPEDHLVTSLPYLKNDAFPTKHYAGLLPANSKKTKYFFYWLFEPDSSIDKQDDIPLLLWMNGGPGCSSMDGMQRSVPLDMHDSTICCITHTHACTHSQFYFIVSNNVRFIFRARSISTDENISRLLEYEYPSTILAYRACPCRLRRSARGDGSFLYHRR